MRYSVRSSHRTFLKGPTQPGGCILFSGGEIFVSPLHVFVSCELKRAKLNFTNFRRGSDASRLPPLFYCAKFSHILYVRISASRQSSKSEGG